MKSLIGLSECCKSICAYKEGLIFLTKALQYAWYCNDTDIEYEVCEKVGIMHYHNGNVESALFYNEK